MSKETASDAISDAQSELTRITDALNEIDQTNFADLPELFDHMAKDAADLRRALEQAQKAIDEIEETEE